MKLDVNKLGIDELKCTPTESSELKYHKNNLTKKPVHDELIKNVNAMQAIDIIDSVKNDYNTKVGDIKRKYLMKINISLLMILIDFQVQSNISYK